MFDIGLQEILFIAFIAVIVFGPDRMPQLAQQAAKWLHTMRGYARRAQEELRKELGPEYSDLNLRDLDPRTMIRKQIQEALAELDDNERQALIAHPEAVHAPVAPPFDPEAT